MTHPGRTRTQSAGGDRKAQGQLGRQRATPTRAEQLCDDHVVALYALAYLLTSRRDLATYVVAGAIDDLSARPEPDCREDRVDIRSELARLIYLGSRALERGAPQEPFPVHDEGAADEPRSTPTAMTSLEALPDQQREAIALCLYGGQSYRDTAELLGLPAESVAGLLASGLHELAAQH